ncbi:sec-independent protein translocase protein TatB [Microbacterium sp. ZKA21]|jgi:sec-independent protein translocase protein TatB|uniref:Sec-independent protein translocase TatB n=1 Tax=Microbacterium sp. ZKA21 TaxID=3381694 RepID=UPI003D1ED06B
MGFGLDFEKLLVIGLIAVLLIGPERLPHYAEQFAKLVRRGGELLRDTKSRVQEEMGPDVADVDWRKLDPRQYDPRRIIRDALFEDAAPAPIAPSAAAAATAAKVAATPVDPVVPRVTPVFTRTSPPPYDPEST